VRTTTKIKPHNRAFHLDRRIDQILALEPPVFDKNNNPDDDLLTTDVVAGWLGVSKEWLEVGRVHGYGPPFKKLGPKNVRYRRGSVKLWLAQRKRVAVTRLGLLAGGRR
jgi:hypothetical protein